VVIMKRATIAMVMLTLCLTGPAVAAAESADGPSGRWRRRPRKR
jgi:hypothetical protein